MARSEMTPMFATQDGQDFYIYKTRGMEKLHNTWRYPHRIGLNLERAEAAREAFVAQMNLAGYSVEFPNPFGGE